MKNPLKDLMPKVLSAIIKLNPFYLMMWIFLYEPESLIRKRREQREAILREVKIDLHFDQKSPSGLSH